MPRRAETGSADSQNSASAKRRRLDGDSAAGTNVASGRSNDVAGEPTDETRASQSDDVFQAVLRDVRARVAAPEGQDGNTETQPSGSVSTAQERTMLPATLSWAESRAQIQAAIDARVALHKAQERELVAALYRAGVERQILKTACTTIDRRIDELQRRRIAILRAQGLLPEASSQG